MGYTEVHAFQTAEHRAVNLNGILAQNRIVSSQIFHIYLQRPNATKSKTRQISHNQKRCTAVKFHSPLRYTLTCKTVHNIFTFLILYFNILGFRLHIFYLLYEFIFHWPFLFIKRQLWFPKAAVLYSNKYNFALQWHSFYHHVADLISISICTMFECNHENSNGVKPFSGIIKA